MAIGSWVTSFTAAPSPRSGTKLPFPFSSSACRTNEGSRLRAAVIQPFQGGELDLSLISTPAHWGNFRVLNIFRIPPIPKTVETVGDVLVPPFSPLKRCVNRRWRLGILRYLSAVDSRHVR